MHMHVQLGVEIALSVCQSVDTKMSILSKLGMLEAEKQLTHASQTTVV